MGGAAEPGAGVALAPLLAVCSGYFMVILDVTIVNVAAPAIGRELSTSLTDLQWIVDGYSVAFAGLLLLGGALGDRWGHRRVFCLGVSVFTGASLGCASRGTPSRSRCSVSSRAAARPCWCPPRWRCCNRSTDAVGPGARVRAVGRDRGRRGHRRPARGRGADVDGRVALGLRHQPAGGVLCLGATLATVGPSPRDPRRVIDPLGQAAVVVTVAALIAALNEAGRQGIRGPAVIAGVLVAAVAAGVFVLRERYGAHPPLPRPLVGPVRWWAAPPSGSCSTSASTA